MSCNFAMFLRCLPVTVICDLSFEVSNILNGDLIPEPGMFFLLQRSGQLKVPSTLHGSRVKIPDFEIVIGAVPYSNGNGHYLSWPWPCFCGSVILQNLHFKMGLSPGGHRLTFYIVTAFGKDGPRHDRLVFRRFVTMTSKSGAF